jgi:hypothetical protein
MLCDDLLPGIEADSACLAFDGGLATHQVLILALGLKLFVVEVLDGRIQQRVNGQLCADESSSFMVLRN